MANPLAPPANLVAFRDLFWSIHVYENRLLAGGHLTQHAASLVKAGSRTNQKSLTDDQRRLLATDYNVVYEELAATRRELHEREAELRIARLDMAVDVLRDSGDLKEKFLAAFAVDFDGQVLAELFAAGKFERESLNNEQLPGHIREKSAKGRELAGDLLTKSRLLFNGLRWWSRGRYGRGSEANGLLKSPLAVRSLQAQAALFMPRSAPKPVDPFQSSARVPDYDRRHHYLWAWEDRQLQVSQVGKSTTQSSELLSKESSGTDYFY